MSPKAVKVQSLSSCQLLVVAGMNAVELAVLRVVSEVPGLESMA